MRVTTSQPLPELRCQHCGKNWLKATSDLLVIKCPRCRTYNTLRAGSPRHEPGNIQSPAQNY